MPTNILPFGTSTNSPTIDLVPIKAFGCTVIDFNVSADWSSQAGSLSFRIIEDDANGDRLTIPVLGSPHLFELKNSAGDVLFQHIGLVESFSRSSNNTSKTYSVGFTSPLTILDSTQVILDGFVGLGGSQEGSSNFSGMANYDFGSRNSVINVADSPGIDHWFNVSNLINVFGILENDDTTYRVPFDNSGTLYSDFGYSSNSQDGIPLIKLMWGLHMGINHLPNVSISQKQRTHGGNLLFGRHNYNVNLDPQGIPYYYHFDALGFYNQVSGILGPQYRIAGQHKTLREIISNVCDEANLEYFSYIDIYTDPTIGLPTLQESDPNWTVAANGSWPLASGKFTAGGNYGGTIRIKTISKNAFFNANRPFSNIAYNLIGLEVPDLKDEYWTAGSATGIHPGKRPVNDTTYGVPPTGNTYYSDPLDSKGLIGANYGFTNVGTQSIASGGRFPVATELWDSGKLSLLKLKSSDISIKMNDLTTMKVITGGYQTRMVTVPRNLLRHYWGDIILPNISDPREVANVETDAFGLNETSTRKIPVVTPLLDPRDVDDYILIDMHSAFGNLSVAGVLKNGVYAASMLEVRCAMRSESSWKAFIETYKYEKLRRLKKHFYPNCVSPKGKDSDDAETLEKATEKVNASGGLGYVGVSEMLSLGNQFALHSTKSSVFLESTSSSGDPIACLSGSGFQPGVLNYFPIFSGCVDGVPIYTSGSGTGCDIHISCALAEMNIRKYILPVVYEKVKDIGETHYGKSWYAPVPYMKTIEDVEGHNLVGNFKRSWELCDSAYIEPSTYYSREVPQSNLFVTDGKVSAFVNYDHNFISTAGSGRFDASYAVDVTSLMNGQVGKVFNFSEYSIDQLCVTRYANNSIIHAAPSNLESHYSFLPYAYDRIYERALLPYSDIVTGTRRHLKRTKSSNLAPALVGQAGFTQSTSESRAVNKSHGPCDPPVCAGTPGIPAGAKTTYSTIIGIPSFTHPDWLSETVSDLQALDYKDNGRLCFPFVKFTTSRVFLPVPKPGFQAGKGMGSIPSADAFRTMIGAEKNRRATSDNCVGSALGNQTRQFQITSDALVNVIAPFQVCVAPASFHYPQVSKRHVYGPWITNISYVSFRGKIEYEQDDSLVPENFLIPINFGQFGSFSVSQTSGLTGLNLAAQGRANAIDSFALFAVEEGSIATTEAPLIKRIGDGLNGVQQITDIKVNVSNDRIETTYSFKTISPRFNKNNRDLEKNLTKISNSIKKLKLK